MENKNDLSYAKQCALFAYLEYCNFIKAAPEKEVYQILTKCKNDQKLDRMTVFIEFEHGESERGKISETEWKTFSERFVENFQLKKRELTQMVCIDVDDEKKIEQSVSYHPEDDWMCLGNAGNEITLSLENYRNLVELAEKVLNQEEE